MYKEAKNELVKERRTQNERRMETRSKLIQAAIQIINESGFANASTIAVSDRAGVSRGALQHHFVSKDDLMAAVVYELTEQVDATQALMKIEGQSIRDKVNYAIDAYWGVYGNDLVISALEIELTSRFDKPLHDRLSDRFDRVGASRDLEWVHLFSDTRLSPQDSVVLRRLLIDALRGLALRKLISGTENVEKELQLLKEMVFFRMTN